MLVFEAALLDALPPFSGFSPRSDDYLPRILDPRSNFFVPRGQAEADERYKQIIPYVVLLHQERVFTYVRGKQTGDKRLVALRSVGLGGHIEPLDLSLFSSDREHYLAAARREVAEEVTVEAPFRESILGVINDESTPVGRVHFGVLHLWELDAPAVRKREAKIAQARFVPVEELLREPERLEGWSRIALEALVSS